MNLKVDDRVVSSSSGFAIGGQLAQQEPQKLRPAGRVSLPVNFPITTSLTYFKKVKDHANLTISAVTTEGDQGTRFSAAIKLAVAIVILFLVNALRKARHRRVRRKSRAVAY